MPRADAGFDPCRSHHGSVAQLAELPPLTRRVAGSTPAGATETSLCDADLKVVWLCRTAVSFGRAATGAVSRLENGCVDRADAGFESLSFRSRRHGRAGKAARCYRVDGASRSQVRVLLPPLFRSGVVESVRRATVTRERQVRALPPELVAPVIERSSGCRGAGHPTGFGRRRSQVRILPARLG